MAKFEVQQRPWWQLWYASAVCMLLRPWELVAGTASELGNRCSVDVALLGMLQVYHEAGAGMLSGS